MHLPKVDDRTCWLANLLQHVSRASSALVVDREDGILGPKLDARAHHSIHLLLHLRISSLHGVEIQLCLVVSSNHGRGGTSAHADAVGRAADLHHQLPSLWLLLHKVVVVHLSETSGKHDGLYPLKALPALRHADPAGPRPPADQGLPKLVAIVAGTIRAVDQDLERRRHVRRVLEVLVLPGHVVAWKVQVAYGVAGHGSNDQRALASALTITDAASCARLGAREGRNAAGEVVRLHGQGDVVVAAHLLKGPRLRHRSAWVEVGVGCASQSTAVVMEADHAVADALFQRPLHPLEERQRHVLAVDDYLPTKEPVAAVL
mmetsp:Transcript_26544/g.61776  ORF Transcript_26544/g.61776 Transcript_26544/m.61776 type:complete len:318 (+) Transcript_26544:2640-3593(+)